MYELIASSELEIVPDSATAPLLLNLEMDEREREREREKERGKERLGKRDWER
jgi:hypothetical protein